VHVLPPAQHVAPVQFVPPHCEYWATQLVGVVLVGAAVDEVDVDVDVLVVAVVVPTVVLAPGVYWGRFVAQG